MAGAVRCLRACALRCQVLGRSGQLSTPTGSFALRVFRREPTNRAPKPAADKAW